MTVDWMIMFCLALTSIIGIGAFVLYKYVKDYPLDFDFDSDDDDEDYYEQIISSDKM